MKFDTEIFSIKNIIFFLLKSQKSIDTSVLLWYNYLEVKKDNIVNFTKNIRLNFKNGRWRCENVECR